MAAEAEAAREARAKVGQEITKQQLQKKHNYSKGRINLFLLQVICAEGEQKASKSLKEAR